MKRKLLLLLIIVVFIVNRFMSQPNEDANEVVTNEAPKISKLITYAKSFEGTPYKFGGTTQKGIDCSGLIFTTFRKIEKQLPRSSQVMSTKGEEVNLEEVKKGDLLFFDIARLQGTINHVGLVVEVTSNDVQFIHSTTSKGVIITSIQQPYWKEAFVKATRVL